MTERADVVVVGGGVQGTLVALHLADAGAGKVRLIDRDQTFQGTSAAAAGFLAYWALAIPQFGHEEVAVERYGLAYYRSVHESGDDVDFLNNGLLILSESEQAWSGLETLATSAWDLPADVVEAARIVELTSGVVQAPPDMRGIFHAAGAQIFSAKLGRVLTDRAVKAGVAIDERRPVIELIVKGSRIAGVNTTTGPILTDTVIVAAGAWTNELVSTVGLFLPMVPRVTSRIVTENLAIPDSLPALMLEGLSDEPHGEHVWARYQAGALLFGGPYRTYPRDAFIDAPVPACLDEVPNDGISRIQELAALASRYMPAFDRYRTMTIKHGAPCYTPDYRALVGPVPGIDGMYVMTGDCECGVTHAPGFAKCLTDHIVQSASKLAPLDAWRVDRFDGVYRTGTEVSESVDDLFASRLV